MFARGFPIAGANCYFLSYCSTEARTPVLRDIRARGGVARTWAFPDGRPDWFAKLDGLIVDAEREGVRLILPLINHWPDFGGAPGLLKVLGIDGPVEEFYRRAEARSLYREWVEMVVPRYAASPAILAWELANEPRCERAVLVDWVREMSAHVKSLDRGRLLGVGDEGQETEALLGIDDIDFGTYHYYPESSGAPADWIERHVEIGRRAGKPVVLEEYGLRDVAGRDRQYAEWTRLAAEGGGSLLWMLGSRNPEVAGFRDAYTIDV
jgi:mannan endo-1,4-beta-mannosidase